MLPTILIFRPDWVAKPPGPLGYAIVRCHLIASSNPKQRSQCFVYETL